MQNSNSGAEAEDAGRPLIDTPTAEHAAPVGEPAARKPAGGLFNPQSRFGRFMRGLTRILAIIVGLFALGMLATYLLLYKPMADQAAAQKVELANARQQISQMQLDLNQTRQDLARLNTTNQTLTHTANLMLDHQALLGGLADVNLARYDLAVGDISKARSDLASWPGRFSFLSTVPADQISAMRSRLELVTSEMDRDPKTAASDLAILADQITALEKQLPSQ